MIERILVPLDGSPLAEAVLSRVPSLLRRPGTEVILLQAVGYPVGRNRDQEVIAAAVRYLREIEARLADEGVRARSVVEPGDARTAIVEAAAREDASLIAMTTHGRTGLQRWAFGSVAERVARSSSIPVLLIRSFPAPGRPECAFRKILVPLDGSELSLAIVPFAAELARTFGATVRLLHVFERKRPVALPGVPERPLESGLRMFRERDIPAETDFRAGAAAAEIVKVGDECDADLIAMMTHGRSGLSRAAYGSVAERVLRRSNVPLLLVRPQPVPSPGGAGRPVRAAR